MIERYKGKSPVLTQIMQCAVKGALNNSGQKQRRPHWTSRHLGGLSRTPRLGRSLQKTVKLLTKVGALDDLVEDAFGFGPSFSAFVESTVAVETEYVS
jgi:hypothetical protein